MDEDDFDWFTNDEVAGAASGAVRPDAVSAGNRVLKPLQNAAPAAAPAHAVAAKLRAPSAGQPGGRGAGRVAGSGGGAQPAGRGLGGRGLGRGRQPALQGAALVMQIASREHEAYRTQAQKRAAAAEQLARAEAEAAQKKREEDAAQQRELALMQSRPSLNVSSIAEGDEEEEEDDDEENEEEDEDEMNEETSFLVDGGTSSTAATPSPVPSPVGPAQPMRVAAMSAGQSADRAHSKRRAKAGGAPAAAEHASAQLFPAASEHETAMVWEQQSQLRLQEQQVQEEAAARDGPSATRGALKRKDGWGNPILLADVAQAFEAAVSAQPIDASAPVSSGQSKGLLSSLSCCFSERPLPPELAGSSTRVDAMCKVRRSVCTRVCATSSPWIHAWGVPSLTSRCCCDQMRFSYQQLWHELPWALTSADAPSPVPSKRPPNQEGRRAD